ncbi:pentapeptide repeat-containing protein [Terrabacter sp. NPDC080008]|uniref:pentapeptide repeat-containing protein n=1 Tax=Terrabacter sp. NPDC080008 TaxID=3155176 RepID=UPI00344E8794
MPSAADQTIFGDALFSTRDQHHDGVRFEGTDFTGAHAEGHTFLECSLVGATLDEAHLAGSRWSECEWERVGGVGLNLAEASIVETTVEGCRLAAVSAWSSTWRDVTVRGGKVDFLNLRGARLKDVAFVDCVVGELDLQEASIDGLTFEGCTLVAPTFGRGTYAGLDLSGATLRSPVGLAALKGATLSRTQVIDLADALAAELGIRVAD